MFKGQDITRLPPNKIAKLGIARTFQTTHLFEQANVLDNVLIGFRLRTKSNLIDALFLTKRLKREEEQSKEKAFEVLKFVGLTNMENKIVANISQEEKKEWRSHLHLQQSRKSFF